MALWDSCALLRFALNDGIIMGVRRMKVTHEGNNGPRILTKRYTPRGNASGGVKKILESKKRGGWDRSRFSAKFVTALARIARLLPSSLLYGMMPEKCNLLFQKCALPVPFARVE